MLQFWPHFGRKTLTRNALKLVLELGISNLDANFTASDEDSYTVLNLNLTAGKQLFDSSLKLYSRQVNIVKLSSIKKSISLTTVGLRLPLLRGLEAAAEATANFLGCVADGKERPHEALHFMIGYIW